MMLGTDEADVQDTIHELEERHIICGYRTLINWGREKEDDITALIELRVTPQEVKDMRRSLRRFQPIRRWSHSICCPVLMIFW